MILVENGRSRNHFVFKKRLSSHQDASAYKLSVLTIIRPRTTPSIVRDDAQAQARDKNLVPTCVEIIDCSGWQKRVK